MPERGRGGLLGKTPLKLEDTEGVVQTPFDLGWTSTSAIINVLATSERIRVTRGSSVTVTTCVSSDTVRNHPHDSHLDGTNSSDTATLQEECDAASPHDTWFRVGRHSITCDKSVLEACQRQRFPEQPGDHVMA